MTDKYCSQCGAEIGSGMAQCPKCGVQLQKKGISTCMIIGIILAVVGFFGLIIIGILAAILVPNFLKARAMGQYTGCKSNCKNIATALEMYSTDNKRHYPPNLDYVTPNYLKYLPTCPAAGKDTYSSSYTSTIGDPDTGAEDGYSFSCEGENHISVSGEKNCPRYDSVNGLSAPGKYGEAPRY